MYHALSPTLQAFCEHEELLRLAYLDRQGFPRVVPVWFVMIDGAYYVGTGTASAPETDTIEGCILKKSSKS